MDLDVSEFVKDTLRFVVALADNSVPTGMSKRRDLTSNVAWQSSMPVHRAVNSAVRERRTPLVDLVWPLQNDGGLRTTTSHLVGAILSVGVPTLVCKERIAGSGAAPTVSAVRSSVAEGPGSRRRR